MQEVRKKCQETCMDEQGTSGKTQTKKGSTEWVEAEIGNMREI